MSKTCLVLAVSLILGLSPPALRAEPPDAAPPGEGQADEASVDALLNAVRSNRKAMVAVNLHLTDEEAAKFWPMYDRYQQEINATGDRAVKVIEEYIANFDSVSDDKAMKLIEEYLSADADRIKIRRTYMPQFAAILPGRKVARLYQIESKMDAVLRYDLASTIPVIEEQAPATK
jgi:hypothetical protein